MIEEREPERGDREAWYAGDRAAWFAYHGGPAHTGPGRIRLVEPGGFVGYAAALKNISGPYADRTEAATAAGL